MQTAIFGGGCFWCTEAVFKLLRGVSKVEPGYAGGAPELANYEAVSTGRTNHAEVIKVEFDPSEIGYRDLLTVFFASHDPTTPNRQGNDVGSQYRSVIFYTSEEQKIAAEQFLTELKAEGVAAVTKIEPLGPDSFQPAEADHHDYYANHPGQLYCELVINPKLEKVQKEFEQLLKTHER